MFVQKKSDIEEIASFVCLNGINSYICMPFTFTFRNYIDKTMRMIIIEIAPVGDEHLLFALKVRNSGLCLQISSKECITPTHFASLVLLILCHPKLFWHMDCYDKLKKD